MSHKMQTTTEYALDQKCKSLKDSILAAEVLIAEETDQSAGTKRSPRLLAAQKNLADAKNLLGEIAADVPVVQRLARLASFPEQNLNPILEISFTGNIEYINPAANKLFPDLQEKGTAHPYLTGWQDLVEKVCREPALPLDREVQLEDCYYQQSIICIEEHHCLRIYGREITTRKNAEQALEQSEKRFRTLIDEAPVAIALSRESKLLYVNPAYLKMHGIDSAAELIGYPIYDQVAPESRDKTKERVIRRAQGLLVERLFESTALRKDGSRLPVLAAVSGVTLAEGPAIVGFFQDISELKQMEQDREELLAQVQMERDRLHSLLESMNDEVWFCDQHGRVLLANQAVVHNLGYSSLEELQTTVSALANDIEVYNPDGSPRSPDEAALIRTLKDEVPVFGEDIVRNRRTGELKYREYNTALIRSEAGELQGAVAVVRDISQRKQAEQALRESQALVNAILNGTPDPVFLKDQECRMLLANSATLAVLGKPAEQVIGKTDAEFYDDPAVGLAIMENDRRVMESGQTEVVEEQVYTPISERVFLSTKTPYRDAGGNIIGVIGVAHDITKRKKQEVELKQLSRTLRAISNSNQALMHAESEKQFMDQVCDIVVKDCGYKMVWIGFAEQDPAKSVQPVASAGFEQGYLDTLKITWADTERGQGPTGTAIRTGQPSLCRNMRTDLKFKPWYPEAIKRGYASSLVLPLLSAGQAFGALTIYSELPDPFSEAEIKLLTELTYDLAYGITSLRLRTTNLKAEAALKESEEKYRRLIENVNDLVCEVDSQAKFVFLNSQYEQILGYTQAELLGKLTRDLIHPEDLRLSTPAFRKLVDGKAISHNEWRYKHKNGEWRWFDCIGQTYEKSPGDIRVVVISRDITERKEREAELYQLNRTLRAISNSNQTLMHAESETQFINEVCDIIVKDCGYKMVWIGFAEQDEAKTVQPVASAGFEQGYIEMLKVTWADAERGQGPAGAAIRSGQPSLIKNMRSDPKFKPWATEAIKRGYASALGLPLLSGGQAFGALTIYSEVVDPFSEDEIKLLSELAYDLANGITTLRLRAASLKAEEALRASEERYRSLFAGMTEGFALHEIVCDENGQPCDYRFLELNPAFERLTGLKQQDVVGNLMSQVLPDDDPNWVKIYGKVALTGQPVHFENYSPVLKAHYEVFAYCPAPRQFAVLFMNITDRKLAEEKIRQSERLYRAIGETIDYGVWVCAPDGRNVYASESFLKLVGMTQQQCSDFGWGDVLHPDDAERTMVAWKECVCTGGTWDIEHRYRGVDGQWHPVLARGVPIRDEQGQIIRWVGINLDISKQKQAEQALQKAHDELEQRVQERTEELQSINEELNTEVEEHKLAEETIFRNAARSENLAEISRRLAAAGLGLQNVYDILSQSLAELIGDSCVVRLLSEDGQELNLASVYHSDPAKREHLSTIMSDLPIKVGEGISGKVIKTGCSFLLPATAPHQLTSLIAPQEQPIVDELQIYSLMCVPLRQEQNIIGTIAVMGGLQRAPYTQDDLSFLEDVANRACLSIAKARVYYELECALEREQHTRAQLIQSEKYAALARMVASVAHEINNPVQTIKNCMYLLSGSIDRASQNYEILDMASSEANRIGNLVSRLRDLYRPSREMTRKTVSMMDVLNNVSALLEPHLVQNKVKMEIETCTDRYCVNANADQIKQVFLNISLNAIDAMEPDGGCLTVKVSCPSDSQVCISFKDTGKGMSAEEMQHIFEPLYTTKEKGTGLGLAISYEIISNHNGHITTESQPGQGTTFSVWLPVALTDISSS